MRHYRIGKCNMYISHSDRQKILKTSNFFLVSRIPESGDYRSNREGWNLYMLVHQQGIIIQISIPLNETFWKNTYNNGMPHRPETCIHVCCLLRSLL